VKQRPGRPASSEPHAWLDGGGRSPTTDRCLEDIAWLNRLPQTWRGRDPTFVIESVLEALVDRLALEFAAFRFEDTAQPFLRVCPEFAARQANDQTLRSVQQFLAGSEGQDDVSSPLGDDRMRLVRREVGETAPLGSFVLCASRSDFPQPMDLIRLDVAAAHAGLACRELRELSEKRRPADLRVERLTGEALAENEWRLNLIINTMPAMAWSATSDGLIDFANQYFLDFVGDAYAHVEGVNFYQIFHPDDMSVLLAAWQDIMVTKQGRDIDGRLRRGDGEYRWCTLRQTPLLGADGEVLKWYGVVLDIEDRKRAELAVRESEAALAASESNLSLILDSLPVLTWSARPDGDADFVNKAWTDYAGLPAEKILGWGFLNLYHPEDIPGMLDIWRRDLETGEETLLKGRILGADGTYRWFLFKGSKLTDAGGVVRWFGANVDIEDLQQAEDALRTSGAALEESERRLQQIISSIPGLAWAADANGFTTFWSQQYLDYAGLRLEDVVGYSFLNHIHPDDLAQVEEAWSATIASGGPGEAEARLRRADGQFRWFLIRASPFYDGAGVLTQWFGVNVEIENRKQAEEDLRRSESELAHVTRMMTMDQLAVSIAHEVNQPLMAIVTNAGTCLRWLDDAQLDIASARRALERIVDDGHRAGDIITSVRALARKSPPKMQRLSLDETLRSVLGLLQGEFRRRAITCIVDFDHGTAVVFGDATQLQQVLMNLIMNALEAMMERRAGERTLTLRTLASEESVEVRVIDTGPGLDPETREKLFEPFFSTKQNGIGMGLSICRSIVETHGGAILAIENSPQGSAFVFTLPTAAGARFNAPSR